MSIDSKIDVDGKLKGKSETFINKVNSNMYFESDLSSDLMSFDWLNEIEFACPYIDNVVRNPKFTLTKEEEVVKIEKAKKITVASIKDLSSHTHYIEKIDPVTQEVKPSKILITRYEDTFNTYENRFLYTLIDNLIRFVMKKESQLNHFESKNSKTLEYAASTFTDKENVKIELKISSDEIPKGNEDNEFENEIKSIKKRLRRIRDYFTSWKRSEFIESLEKERVSLVTPPIKKTNTILKNPNFQIAMKLWEFLQRYDEKDSQGSKESLNTSGDNVLRGILDDSFLMNYVVLDSISSSRREQKEKLSKYAIVMLNQQIQRAVSILINNGIKITEEEILAMIANEMKIEKNKRLIGSTDVKKKFKSAIEEYLERTQDFV